MTSALIPLFHLQTQISNSSIMKVLLRSKVLTAKVPSPGQAM